MHSHDLIHGRNILTDETAEFEVGCDKIEAVDISHSLTHSIINLRDTEDLITVKTCNELFDQKKPDTFGESV